MILLQLMTFQGPRLTLSYQVSYNTLFAYNEDPWLLINIYIKHTKERHICYKVIPLYIDIGYNAKLITMTPKGTNLQLKMTWIIGAISRILYLILQETYVVNIYQNSLYEAFLTDIHNNCFLIKKKKPINTTTCWESFQ